MIAGSQQGVCALRNFWPGGTQLGDCKMHTGPQQPNMECAQQMRVESPGRGVVPKTGRGVVSKEGPRSRLPGLQLYTRDTARHLLMTILLLPTQAQSQLCTSVPLNC
jgi:hypothetical protein